MEIPTISVPVSPLVATVLEADPAIAASFAAVGMVDLIAPPEMTIPVETSRLEASRSQLSRFAARAGAFVQPNPQKLPPMTLAMALVINVITVVPRLDSAWPRNGRRYPVLYYVHVGAFQNRLASLISAIPVLRYRDQLRCFDMLTDRQMEEVRLFCILVDVLREATGSSGADPGIIIRKYLRMCARRQVKLSQDLRNFGRMLMDMANHEEGATDSEGSAEEGD